MISCKEEIGESKFELAISYLLIVGIVASLLFVGIGIILFYVDFGHLAISEKEAMFLGERDFFHFLWGLLQGEYAHERAIWLMTLGIAILILTPYARVIMSILYFIGRKDIKYTLITLFVFIILTVSLLFP